MNVSGCHGQCVCVSLFPQTHNQINSISVYVVKKGFKCDLFNWTHHLLDLTVCSGHWCSVHTLKGISENVAFAVHFGLLHTCQRCWRSPISPPVPTPAEVKTFRNSLLKAQLNLYMHSAVRRIQGTHILSNNESLGLFHMDVFSLICCFFLGTVSVGLQFILNYILNWTC